MKQFKKESLKNGGWALFVTIILVLLNILTERIPTDNEFFIAFALFFLMFQTVSIIEIITSDLKAKSK